MNYDDDYDENEIEESELAEYFAGRPRNRNMSYMPKGKKTYMRETTRDVLEDLLADYDDDMNYDPDRRKTLFPELTLDYNGKTVTGRRGNMIQFKLPAGGYNEIPQPEMRFDGKHFDVYYDDEAPSLRVPAMSGKKGFQNRIGLSIEDNGSIPEGEWYIDPQKLQKIQKPLEKMKSIVRGEVPATEIPEFLSNKRKYSWVRKPEAWGEYRVPLEPAPETETYDRKGMYLHGGTLLGSAGCVDVGDNIKAVAPYIKRAKKPIKLKVKYHSDEWER